MNKEQLKQLYDSQCDPCVCEFPGCGGSVEKAKLWKCSCFVNGLFVLEVKV